MWSMSSLLKRWALSICLLSFLHCYHAFPSYQRKIPNGDKVPNPCNGKDLWMGVGHYLVGGGGELNPFGHDLHRNQVNTGGAWNKIFCESDSDGDGLTNGQELGDPMCTWPSETELPKTNTTITHPGICEPTDSENCKKRNNWLKCVQNEFNCPAILDPDVKALHLRVPKTKIQTNYSFICSYFHVPMEHNYHVIAVEQILDNKEVLHHILLYGCDLIENMPKINDPQLCPGDTHPPNCDLIRAWNYGAPDYECFPEQFGIAIGKQSYTYFMVTVHYENHDHVEGLFDSSGVTLYYTPRLRPHNGGLIMGKRGFSLEPRRSRLTVDNYCAGYCTKRGFYGPIYIYSTNNHIHDFGREIKLEHYRNGTLLNSIIHETDYTFFKHTSVINQKVSVEVLPGDALLLKCIYDTTSTNKITTYGWGPGREMCYSFITVYPKENIEFQNMCFTYSNSSDCNMENRATLGYKSKEIKIKHKTVKGTTNYKYR